MIKRFSASLSLWTALALCVGCAEPTDGDVDGTPESTVGAFSEAACATANTDQTLMNFTRGTTVVGMTPTTYSNPGCFKAFLFDLGTLSGAIPGQILPPYDIAVQWTDPWPRTQAQCATTLGMQVYTPGFTYGPITAESRWENGACKLGWIGLSSTSGLTGTRIGVLTVSNNSQGAPYFAGYSVRLAVTARTAANSTQSVKVSYSLSPAPPPPPCPEC